MMATEDQIQKVLINLAIEQSCQNCDTRLRFGDLDCPHCGENIDETLKKWAVKMVDDLIS